MTKENKSHMIYPDVSPKDVNKNYKKFLKRHGWKTTVEGIKPIRKEK